MTKLKKYQAGAAGAAATSGAGAGSAVGGFEGFMGNYGAPIAQAAGTLMPLLMKKPDANAKPYKKGSKLIKYDEGVMTIKNDSIKYKTPKGDVATGATVEEMPRNGATSSSAQTPAPVRTTTAAPKTNENFKGLTEGFGMSKGQEVGSLAAMTAIGEMFPEKSKLGWIGKALRKGLKYGPTVARNVHDLVFEAANKGIDNINWRERIGNLLQDVSVGTTASGLMRTVKGAGKNIKQQITTAASKNPEKDIIEPISFKKAAGKGAMEAAEKSTVVGLPTAGIKFAKDITQKGRTAMGNIKTSQQKIKTAKELEAANTAATNLALSKKHTGPANSKKGVGVEGSYYVKGVEVPKEKYEEHLSSVAKQKETNKNLRKTKEFKEMGGTSYSFEATPAPGMGEIANQRKKVSEELNSINSELKKIVGEGSNKKNISDLTPDELKKYQELENKKKPLITYISQTTQKVKTEAPGKTGAASRKAEIEAKKKAEEDAKAAAEATAKKTAANEGKKAALEKARAARDAKKAKEAAAKKAKEEAEKKKKINFKPKTENASSNKPSGKASSKKSNKKDDDDGGDPPADVVAAMEARMLSRK
jgi:hypothetical protein